MTITYRPSYRPSPSVGAGAAVLALAAVYALAVRTVPGQSLDTQVMLVVSAALRGSGWTETVLDLVSPALVLYATAVVALVAVLIRGLRTAVTATGVVAVTLLTSELLKAGLTRPTWLDSAGNSLPSGHVAAAAAVAAAAVIVAPRAVRLPVAGLGAVGVVVTGVATMAEQWHRPSDVVAAVLVAVAVGLGACVRDPRRSGHEVLSAGSAVSSR